MAKKANLTELPEALQLNIDPKVFNDVYYPYLNTINRYEVFYGSAGSGKSFYIAQRMALQMSIMPGRNMLCVRKAANDARDSVYPEMEGALRDFKLLDIWSIVEHPKVRMVCMAGPAEGNEIVFDGMDNVENIKSIKFKSGKNNKGNLTDIWYEEATEETDIGNIRQLDLRLRDRHQKGRIILSFNPVSVQHPLKKYIEEEIPLSNDYMVLKTTYKDNRFIDDQYKATLENLRHTDPYRYMVYAKGEWGVMGETVFNATAINERIREVMDVPFVRVSFDYEEDEHGTPDVKSYEIRHDSSGDIKIFVEPEPRHPYVMSLDTAGEGHDFNSAQVIDALTGEQVAVLHSKKSLNQCIHQAFFLAKYYNNALYCPEVNFEGGFAVSEFKRLGYTNFYMRGKDADQYTDGYEQKIGFRTTSQNRGATLEEMIAFVNKNTHLLNDYDTLNEMLSFVRVNKPRIGVRMEAAPGAHDDLVLAYAIVLAAREQASTVLQAEHTDKLTGTWTERELKDAKARGSITVEQARDYKRRGGSRHVMTLGAKDNAQKRRSRYAR